jgi:hypothetical protein
LFADLRELLRKPKIRLLSTWHRRACMLSSATRRDGAIPQARADRRADRGRIATFPRFVR